MQEPDTSFKLPTGARAALRHSRCSVAVLVAGLMLGSTARADFKVRSPLVEEGEIEYEHNGSVTFDKNKSGKNNDQSYTHALGYGVTSFWMAEVEGEFEAAPGSNLRFNATTFENTFQLTPQGKYFADLGFFAEYAHVADRNNPDTYKFGPLVDAELGSTLHTLNLLFEKQIGLHRTDATDFTPAWQSRWRLHPLFEPGFEYYGDIGDIASPGKLAEQQHRVGPVLVGLFDTQGYGKFKYELGYLIGLTRGTEKGTVRWKLEYEFRF
jgi:hypothetical protein